jgi:hypothetical protein
LTMGMVGTHWAHEKFARFIRNGFGDFGNFWRIPFSCRLVPVP